MGVVCLQRAAVDSRVERQRAVMQQLADMRHSASSLQKRVARLTGDVHPRLLTQVNAGTSQMPFTLLLVGLSEVVTVDRRSSDDAQPTEHNSHIPTLINIVGFGHTPRNNSGFAIASRVLETLQRPCRCLAGNSGGDLRGHLGGDLRVDPRQMPAY